MAIWIPNLTDRSGPLYLQIVDVMAEDIATGRLPAGARMPPHRELAYQLNISPNTTSRAYAEAVKRALLRGEVGRGTFVRGQDSTLSTGEPESLRRTMDKSIDLSKNLPMPGFSEPYIRQVFGELAASSGVHALLDYQTDADLLHHREAGKTWLKDCGIRAEIDGVVPTMGGQHGIFSVLVALLQPGDLLLTEALTYTPVLAMAARLNLNTATLASDSKGVIPESFEVLCRTANPKALYLSPTLQAPTTTTLSAKRRKEIAAIANRYGVLLIEDDVFGPLKQNKPSPISRSAPDNTVYITSLSKTVAPGLRVGFLYAPKRLVPALHQAINLSVWMTPPMNLEVACRLIQAGTATKLTEHQRQMAKHRQKLARQSLGSELVPDHQDGYHIWVPLPTGWRADVFSAECARLGVQVSEGRSFAAQAHDAPEAIRICISHEPNEDRVQRGLEIVSGVLQSQPSGSSLSI